MNDEPKSTVPQQSEGISNLEKPSKPSFGSLLLSIYVEPRVVFDFLKVWSDFWRPFIVIAVIMMIITYFTAPTTWSLQRDFMIAAGKPLPQQVLSPVWIGILGAVFAPLGLAIGFLISAAITWLLVVVVSGAAKYSQLLSITVYSYFPPLLAGILSAIVTLLIKPQFAGIDTYLKSLQPVQFYTSLALLTPGSVGFSALLINVSIFELWGLYLLYLGLRRAIGLRASQAFLVVVIMLVLQLGVGSLRAFQLARTFRVT